MWRREERKRLIEEGKFDEVKAMDAKYGAPTEEPKPPLPSGGAVYTRSDELKSPAPPGGAVYRASGEPEALDQPSQSVPGGPEEPKEFGAGGPALDPHAKECKALDADVSANSTGSEQPSRSDVSSQAVSLDSSASTEPGPCGPVIATPLPPGEERRATGDAVYRRR